MWGLCPRAGVTGTLPDGIERLHHPGSPGRGGKLPCGKQAQAGSRGQKEKGESGPPLKMIIRDLDLCKGDIL